MCQWVSNPHVNLTNTIQLLAIKPFPLLARIITSSPQICFIIYSLITIQVDLKQKRLYMHLLLVVGRLTLIQSTVYYFYSLQLLRISYTVLYKPIARHTVLSVELITEYTVTKDNLQSGIYSWGLYQQTSYTDIDRYIQHQCYH